MKNICDYVISYQNEKFEKMTEIDALIFARLAYIHLEDIMDKIPVKIGEIANYAKNIKINFRDRKLIDILKNANRYKDLEIINCQSIVDSEKEEQFMAITIMLPKKSIVVSFRGTNKSMVGFKEDLNMSFDIIPSQISAKEYVNNLKKYRKLYLVGHSKGGNLAMYAAMHLPFWKEKRLVNIYNFDGPGFLTLDKKFQKIRHKLLNFFPETCIVGRLLENDSEYTVIKTNTFGLDAHNVYNWIVDDAALVRGSFTVNSDEFAANCENFLMNVSVTNRKIIINFIYELMLKGEISNFKEMNLEKAKDIIKRIPNISKKEKDNLNLLIKAFLKALLPNKRT